MISMGNQLDHPHECLEQRAYHDNIHENMTDNPRVLAGATSGAL